MVTTNIFQRTFATTAVVIVSVGALSAGAPTVSVEDAAEVHIEAIESITQANLSRSLTSTDYAPTGIFLGNETHTATPGSLWGETDSSDSRYEEDTVKALESRPEASKTIFLDFDGAILSDTEWSRESDEQELVYPALSFDDVADFDLDERAVIYYTWAIISENFAPYDVNVTTKIPDVSKIIRSSEDDIEYGIHVIFTSHELDGLEDCHCNGIATLSVFGNVEPDKTPSPAFVNPKFGKDGFDVESPLAAAWILAHIGTHEIGHTIGLRHDGKGNSEEYSSPIGPVSFFMGLTPKKSKYARWSNGALANSVEDNAGAMVNGEDDLTILANALGLLPDDMPDSIFNENLASMNSWEPVRGLLTDHRDTDVFKVYVPVTSVISIEAKPGLHNYQLSAAADLYDSDMKRLTPSTENRRWRTKFENGKASYVDFAIDRHYAVVEPGFIYVRISAGSGWPHLPEVDQEEYGSLGSWEALFNSIALNEESFNDYANGMAPVDLYMQLFEEKRAEFTEPKDKESLAK